MKDLQIVTLGGGTGLSVLLSGLKRFTNNITAVVSVADDGGGSGVLREDLGMLPPGDIRACIIALANQEPVLQELFGYRFQEGRLDGQNFGNLMIAALQGINGSFEKAVEQLADIFAISGRVLPVTFDEVDLLAELANEKIVQGESSIPREVLKGKTSIKRVTLTPQTISVNPKVIEAIEDADIIIAGPGSLYTSVIPNLLMPGVCEALQRSKALRVYVSNVMTQPGETDGFSLKEHVLALEEHIGRGYFQYIVANEEIVDEETKKRYASEGAAIVEVTDDDRAFFEERSIHLVTGEFAEVKKGYLRHDAVSISKAIIELMDARIYRRDD